MATTIQVNGEDVDVTNCANKNCAGIYPKRLTGIVSSNDREKYNEQMRLYFDCVQSKCNPTTVAPLNKNTENKSNNTTITVDGQKINSDGKKGVSMGAIIGIGVGVIALIVVVVLVKRKNK